ncbi:MAG: hypothetical protein GEV28_06845 [Actinophytocola sp.]|uniref:hypothetical protein n=1 Tax=Actinophytocola sp. TaxID=1872138 RepID=UPI001324566A|nr:hypothetical protein [Actinophytocola sp.]
MNEAVRGTLIGRRRLLGDAAPATGLIASVATALAGTRPQRVRLTVPKPTGPHAVGTVSLHLVDHARQDPWSSTPHPRELMVSRMPRDTRTRGPGAEGHVLLAGHYW